MAVIYETKNFIIESHERPEIDRLEWGHIKISPKIKVKDRTELSPSQATELMYLTIVSGEALTLAMQEIWITIGRINYQDNGNRKPNLHLHLYGRATTALSQKYWEPIIPWHKPEYTPLNEDDIYRIQQHIHSLLQWEKFTKKYWMFQ